MDGLQSFALLVDSLPQWQQRLDALSQQVTERHAEFTQLARTSSGQTRSIRKQKTGSMESLRPQDEVSNIPEPPSTAKATTKRSAPSTPPVRVDINPESKRLFQDYRLQSKRKRTSTSIISAVSGAQKFRSRMSLIVYYDSAIQESFEWLVRNISSARNNLRKGKTSASFKARIASMGMEESPFSGDRSDYSMRNPNVPRLPRTQGKYLVGGYSAEAFDQADRELEAAQSLCEIGAHQFLREGVCTDELSGTRERFDTCLRIAKEQQQTYEDADKEKALADKQRKQSDSSKSTDSSKTDVEGIEVDPNMAVDSLAIDNKFDVVKVDSIAVDSGLGFGTGEIEIDDDDDSHSFHVDLSAFRKTRRYGPRG